MNQLHEARCAMYIMHMYNHAVVDNFLGDEYIGAERNAPLIKEKMATSVKEVLKLIAKAKAATGNDGGPFAGKSKRVKGGGRWKQPAKQGGFLPPGFDEPKSSVGGQLGTDRPKI